MRNRGENFTGEGLSKDGAIVRGDVGVHVSQGRKHGQPPHVLFATRDPTQQSSRSFRGIAAATYFSVTGERSGRRPCLPIGVLTDNRHGGLLLRGKLRSRHDKTLLVPLLEEPVHVEPVREHFEPPVSGVIRIAHAEAVAAVLVEVKLHGPTRLVP